MTYMYFIIFDAGCNTPSSMLMLYYLSKLSFYSTCSICSWVQFTGGLSVGVARSLHMHVAIAVCGGVSVISMTRTFHISLQLPPTRYLFSTTQGTFTSLSFVWVSCRVRPCFVPLESQIASLPNRVMCARALSFFSSFLLRSCVMLALLALLLPTDNIHVRRAQCAACRGAGPVVSVE